MHIKFLAGGTGSARDAADYLLGERDATGQPRQGVEVLRGDPHGVAAVADTLAFGHKYTSGVIAWAPDDQPTDEEIEAVLDAFEETAWAGLEADRYAWAAVLHRERGGGAHVHVLAARCDLETGRSLNIAPPGWRKTFDPLRDAFNHEYGWNRPDDPARARVQHPGHRSYVEVVAVFRTPGELERARTTLGRWANTAASSPATPEPGRAARNGDRRVHDMAFEPASRGRILTPGRRASVACRACTSTSGCLCTASPFRWARLRLHMSLAALRLHHHRTADSHLSRFRRCSERTRASPRLGRGALRFP